MYDELVKKYVSPLFWDDLEKPYSRLLFDPNAENYLNQIFRRGMQNMQKQKGSEKTRDKTTDEERTSTKGNTTTNTTTTEN